MANSPASQFKTTSGTDSLLTLTFTADTIQNRQFLLNTIHCGYDVKPAAGSVLTVKSGVTTIFKLPLTEYGPAPLDMTGFYTHNGEDLVVTLSAGGSGVTGYLNASAWLD